MLHNDGYEERVTETRRWKMTNFLRLIDSNAQVIVFSSVQPELNKKDIVLYLVMYVILACGLIMVVRLGWKHMFVSAVCRSAIFHVAKI